MSQQMRRQEEERKAERQGRDEPEEDRLHCGNSSAVGVPFADASRDHRGGRHAKPHADSKDQGQHRLRQPDGGNRIRAQAADPEDVDHGKERFEHHLQHHGDGEQQDRPVQAAGSVVLVAAAQGFSNRLPEGRRCGGIGLCLHARGHYRFWGMVKRV